MAESAPLLINDPLTLSAEQFIEVFGGVFEHSPWVAEQLWMQGLQPRHRFVHTLHADMLDIVLNADRQRQLALINAHPDLAGRLARAGELGQASSLEQAGAGLDQCSDQEYRRFTELNQRYRDRFGFPFIMAIRHSHREQILQAFGQRLNNDIDSEFRRALDEIGKIALYRLTDL